MRNAEFPLNLAVVIGINDYQNGIPTLGTARQDAEAIAELFATEYHYQVHLITDRTPLLATQQNLITWLESELPTALPATSASRLLFYFAGHGIALNGDDGPEGYLIPQDARLGDISTYIPMQQVEAALTRLSCRHCLVILDCCFAGAFRWSSTRRLIPISPVIHKERFDRFIQDPAWQVITSAASDQYALDSLDLRGDRGLAQNHHSPFAAALITALNGAADIYPPATRGKAAGDGVITATELYLYLRDAVEIPTDGRNQRQTPQIWCLKKHDKGEFIFRPPGHVLNLPAAPALDEAEASNPYRGLKSYEISDNAIFFGRSRLIDQLSAAIRDRPLTVVLGASGSGKSSLVKAGLIPNLNTASWQVLGPMRPGESPLTALQTAFKAFSGIASDPSEAEGYIAAIANWHQTNPETKLLLVVDQWEELITLCDRDEDRAQFLRILADLLQADPNGLRLVVTLRSDFEPQFSNTPLDPLWAAARFVVPAMTRDELRAVIESPASAKVVYFESLDDRGDLADRLIDEVAGMPGSLPLLSFALSELYLKLARRYQAARTSGETIDRVITWADYDALGGVTKSLTRRADEEYAALIRQDAAYQQTIRQVMLRMVAVGGELARRQVPESELRYPEPENTRVQAVIERFAIARLLVRGTDANDHPYIEPAHDALVRGWEKLLAWQQSAAADLILQRRLSPAATEWNSVKRQETLSASGIPAKAVPVIHWVDRRLFTIENRLNQIPQWFWHWFRKYFSRSTASQTDIRQSSGQFLWNTNPYLEVLQNELKTQGNWLNQVEREFVQESLLQKRRTRSWRWRIAISVMLGLSGLTIAALIGQRAALISQIRAARESAEADFRSGQQLDAFINSLHAAQTFKHPLLQLFKPEHQLETAVQGTLQKAVYSNQEYNRLGGNQGTTRSTISPNGNLIATMDDSGIVKLLNPQGQQTTQWDTAQGHSMNVIFSPDGQQLATAGTDNTVRLWNLQGQLLAQFEGHTDMVKGISFSPDGQRLATAGRDTTIRLWNLQGKQLAQFAGHTKDIWSVAFSPDGKILASASDDHTFRLWNMQGKQLRNIQANQAELHNIKFSPNGQRLATVGDDGSIRLWNLEGRPLATLKGHQGTIWNVVFSADGQQLASAGADGTVRLWDLKEDLKGNLKAQASIVLRGHQGPVRHVNFMPDGQRLVSSGDDSTARLWDLQGQQQVSLTGHQGPVRSILFDPRQQQLLTSGEDGTIRRWAAPDKLLDTFTGNTSTGNTSTGNLGPVRSIDVSVNGQQMASAQGQTVSLWNLADRSAIALSGHQGLVRSVQFSPDGQRLVSAGDDGTIRLWNMQGQPLAQWQADAKRVWSVGFSPDGQSLVSAGEDGVVRLWNLQGKSIGQLEGHLGPVFSVMFRPDGQRIASAGQDSTVRLWDVATKRKVQLFQVYDAEVNSVAFSPDGQYLISGDSLGNVQLWDLSAQQQFADWNAHRNAIVRQVRFSLDGQQVATAGDDGIAKIWQLDTFDQLLVRGCARMDDYLKLALRPAGREGDRRCSIGPKR